MSFRRLLDRTVSVQQTAVTGDDGHGNDVISVVATLGDVPAGRDLAAADEDLGGVDRQRADFVYFLPTATDGGAPVLIDGYSRIVDGADTFEVIGQPDLIVRRRGGRAHHWEVLARKTEG